MCKQVATLSHNRIPNCGTVKTAKIKTLSATINAADRKDPPNILGLVRAELIQKILTGL